MRRRRGDIAKGWRHRSLSVAFAQKITSFYTAPIRAVTTIVRGEMGVIFIFSSLFYSFVVLFFFSLPGPLFCRQLTYGMSGDYTVRYGLGGRKTWRRETNKRRKKNGIFSLSFSGSRGFGRPLPQRHAHVRRAAATLCSLRATSFSVHFFFFFSSCVFSKLHIIVCRTASLSYFLSFVCCHFVNVIYWHERIPRFPALLIPRLSHFLYKRKKKKENSGCIHHVLLFFSSPFNWIECTQHATLSFIFPDWPVDLRSNSVLFSGMKREIFLQCGMLLMLACFFHTCYLSPTQTEGKRETRNDTVTVNYFSSVWKEREREKKNRI